MSLLRLPDPCLVEVLHSCAGDRRTMCSAARAHSRLHQAAVVALSSITANVNQQQLDVLVDAYLHKYGQHVDSLSLLGGLLPSCGQQPSVRLLWLPMSVHQQLTSLTCEQLYIQLLPEYCQMGCAAVLSDAWTAPLKQLRLKNCKLFDQQGRLAAALEQLPDLEHLSIDATSPDFAESRWCGEVFTGASKQLTFLELAANCLQAHRPWQSSAMMAAFTQLVDLRLMSLQKYSISASMMSGLQRLIRLQMTVPHSYKHPDARVVVFQPGALSGKTCLQHLELINGRVEDADGERQLLSHLGELQLLTYLSLQNSLHHCAEPDTFPAAAYSALTASTKLQHLDISGCTVAAALRPHMLPASRQVPHLRSLDISDVKHLVSTDTEGLAVACHATAPEVTCLVSCCPNLQSLSLLRLQGSSTELLDPLKQLSGLQQVRLDVTCEYHQRIPTGWARKRPFGWGWRSRR